MNLETAIDSRLWSAIQSSYESRQFTAAILDAVYFVADIIREKSGVSADGVSLIGQAFGGKAPLLKVNKLQTETERSVQSGVEQLLKGIFQAIRNPRSHEKAADSQNDAIAIILFLNYLISIIDATKSLFSKEQFLAKVFDKNFVEKSRYAELLVEEIPIKQRLDVMIEVYRAKQTGEGKKLRVFTHALFATLTSEDRGELNRVVADELMQTEDEADVRLTLQMLPAELLNALPELVKYRLENRLIKSIGEGIYDPKSDRCKKGSLGTWLDGRFSEVILRDELEQVICKKLRSPEFSEHEYVRKYLPKTLQEYARLPSAMLIASFRAAIKAGSNAALEIVASMKQQSRPALSSNLSAAIKAFVPKNVVVDDFMDDDIPF